MKKKSSLSPDRRLSTLSRRRFIASTLKAGVAAAVFPAIVPASVFGKYAPSNRINVGAIGTGRISRIHDLPGIWKYDQARIIAEGRIMANRVRTSGRIFQIGSQQRSSSQFRYAAELVRNGRIGELKTVYVGLPGDPSGDVEPEMPVPPNLNYDAWLGSTPLVYYTEKRVHPQSGFDRPGWLRCEQFGAGMITGWGAHHIDSAHWGMDTEYTGPIEVWGHADFPTKGLWDVHGIFRTEALYANGVRMVVSNELPNGIKFEGTKGWLFVTRGDYRVTASDPVPDASGVKPLDASDPAIIRSVIGPKEIHLYVSDDQHGNWLDSIATRNPPITNAEIAHRACSTCLIHHITMKLNRKVYWDPVDEKFKNDDEANRMLSRPQRAPYLVV
jgi:predicted dehydrogenase